jgi:hypothetical protein
VLAFFPNAGALCDLGITKSTRGAPVLDQKTLEALTPSEKVSHAMRVLALNVDPAEGKLSALADEIGVHPATISAWIAGGYVPEFQVEKLEKRFGRKLMGSLPL